MGLGGSMKPKWLHLAAVLVFGVVLLFPVRDELSEEQLVEEMRCLTDWEVSRRSAGGYFNWLYYEEYAAPFVFTHEERLRGAFWPAYEVNWARVFVEQNPEVFLPHLERMAASIDFQNLDESLTSRFFGSQHIALENGYTVWILMSILGKMQRPEADAVIADFFDSAVRHGRRDEGAFRGAGEWSHYARIALRGLLSRNRRVDAIVRSYGHQLPVDLLTGVVQHYRSVSPCDPEVDRLLRTWIREDIPSLRDSGFRATVRRYLERSIPGQVRATSL